MRLTVVGDGPERANVEALARTLGVAERIHWTGVIADADRLLRAFDTFVLSSRTEGTPITLLEAMRACVPIVATAVGGVPDVLSESEGLVVLPESPSALADAIRDALTGKAAAVARATRARKRLESQFALGPWLDAYERIYIATLPPATPAHQ